MRRVSLFWEFLRHPKQVGSLVQSSKFLAEKMAEEIGSTTEVVEFGAGTGCITSEILKHLPENGRLTCFEINPRLCRHLKKINDSRLTVINDDAAKCGRYVNESACVVSGLPLALFSKPKRQQILTIARRSKKYVQFQYTPLLTNEIKRHFANVKIKFLPLNIPPAFIYICKNHTKDPDKQTARRSVSSK